jgi:hypothetical protein
MASQFQQGKDRLTEFLLILKEKRNASSKLANGAAEIFL